MEIKKADGTEDPIECQCQRPVYCSVCAKKGQKNLKGPGSLKFSLLFTHTKARLVTYPVRGLHYGPTLKVVTLDLQELTQ